MINELWKDIPEYEKLYQGSNLGRIRSLDRWVKYSDGRLRLYKGSILKPCKNTKGYLHVKLCKDGRGKIFDVHRLVYEAFNGTIPEGYEINHIDENTENNCLSNLSAVSHKDNINWGTHNKRVSVAMTNGKLSDPVLQLTLDDVLVKEWPSMNEAERQIGARHANISACCLGKLKTYKGFKWVKKINYIKENKNDYD